jgi:putative transposase
MIDENHKKLSVRKQCELMSVNRSSVYYSKSEKKASEDFEIKLQIKRIYFNYPFYGHRKIKKALEQEGIKINRKRVLKLMKELNLTAIFPKKNLSKPAATFEKYPYLLKDLEIKRINQVWQTDITYLKVNGSNVYLVGIIDAYSRKALSWNLSNTMDKYFCIETLENSINKYGKPEIFNSDQGSQFTSKKFQNVLKDNNIKISMVSKGRATDNIYIERLWRSLKYEEIYLKEYCTLTDCKKSVNRYFEFYVYFTLKVNRYFG